MSDRAPPFTALRAVEAAARHRSFSSAAKELNVTHSAVSQAVKRLEGDLGVELFARRGSGMEPSDAALRLAQTYSGAAESLLLLIREISGETAPDQLQLFAAADIQTLWLAPRIARLKVALPDFAVLIEDTGGAAEMTLDRAVGARPDDILAPVRLAAAWRMDLFPVRPKAIADLLQHPIVAVGPSDARAWTTAHRLPEVGAAVLGPNAVDVALSGQAVIVADALLLEPLLARGDLIGWPELAPADASWTLRARIGPGKAGMADRLRLWFQLEMASAQASLRRSGLAA